MFFKKKKRIEEQNKIIAELNEKLEAQRQKVETLDAQLAAYRQREFAISRALTDAAETANRIVIDAQRESDDIHDSAQKDFIASQKKGEAVIQNAYENARGIINEAEKTSEEKIRKTDAAVCAYVQLLNQFNESMKEQARQAEENVKKLSDYYARLNNALPELFAEVPQLSQTIDKQAEEDQLPDPEGDPAQLMRNIYTIQNRYLPHEDIPDRTSVPEEQDKEDDPAIKAPEPEAPAEEKTVPQFEAEEGAVVRVSDIVAEDLGTIDTDELISKTADYADHPIGAEE